MVNIIKGVVLLVLAMLIMKMFGNKIGYGVILAICLHTYLIREVINEQVKH